ncbi:MAG: hypothetical protein GX166_10260 [Clostridiaceae bacterium]|nr:hypothetical protein [Clostridiaceae bacterium]
MLFVIVFIFAFVVVLLSGRTEAKKEFVIVFDAGHGGRDPGAVYNDKNGVEIREKDLNLKIVKYAIEELKKYENVKIYETRPEDNYLTLGARMDFAKFFNADLFISVHNNAGDPSARGTLAFVPSGNYRPEVADEVKRVANKILEKVSERTGLRNRGVSTRTYTREEWVFYPNGTLADYYGIVKRGIDQGIPSLIMEYAFMSNPDDLEFLTKDENLRKLGKATADAIVELYGLFPRSSGSYDNSHQPKLYQKDLQILKDGIKLEYTFGDGPFTLPVSGGSGDGLITFEFDTLRVFQFDGEKIHIIGADKNIRVYASKGTDGTYMPVTSSNWVTLTVNPKRLSFSLSYQVVDDKLLVTFKVNDMVEGFLPRGKAAFYVDGKLYEKKDFSSDTVQITISDPKPQGKIVVKYEDVTVKNLYVDFYIIDDAEITYTSTPSTEVPTTPTPKPIETETPEPTESTPSPTEATPAPTETSPDTTNTPVTTNSPGPTELEGGDKEDKSMTVLIIALIVFVVVLAVVIVLYFIKFRKK